MTKDVLVSVEGTHHDTDSGESISTLTRGEYYLKNGKHYIIYEEASSQDAGAEVVKCTIKLSENRVDIMKKLANGKSGFTNNISFESGKIFQTLYNTPYGDIETVFDTTGVEITEEENEITATVYYNLIMNGEHVSRCTTVVRISAVL